MPKYEITGPDGRRYEVTAPEGASQDDVLNFVRSQIGTQPAPQRSVARQVGDFALGTLNAVNQGILRQGFDEFQAAGKTLMGMVPGIGDGKSYQQNLDEYRQREAAYKQQFPGTALAAEMAGGIATDPATYAGPAGVAVGLGRQMATSAASGAAQGAATGYNAAEGGVADRLGGALEGGAMGAAIGAAAPAALAGLATGARWTADQLISRFFPGMQANAALRKAAEALARDGMDPQQAAARLAEMGPDAVLADLGKNTRALTAAVARQPGQGATAIDQFVTARQEGAINADMLRTGGQARRITEQINKMVPDRFQAGDKMALQADQKAATAAGYAMVNNPENVVPPERFAELFNSDPWLEAEFKRIANDPFYKRQGMPLTSLPVIDAVKKKLDAGAAKALADRDNYDAMMFKSRLDDIKAITDAAFPQYANTRAIWKEFAGISDAADLGRQWMSGKVSMKNDEMRLAMESMSPADLEAFRIGSAEGLRDRIGGVVSRADVTKKLMGVPDLEDRMRMAFGGAAGFKDYVKKLVNEEEMFKLYGSVKTGSQTAERQAADQALQQDPGAVLEAVGSVASGWTNPANYLRLAGQAARRMGGPQLPEDARNKLADILLGRAPEALNTPYVTQMDNAEIRRRLARALATGATTQVGG